MTILDYQLLMAPKMHNRAYSLMPWIQTEINRQKFGFSLEGPYCYRDDPKGAYVTIIFLPFCDARAGAQQYLSSVWRVDFCMSQLFFLSFGSLGVWPYPWIPSFPIIHNDKQISRRREVSRFSEDVLLSYPVRRSQPSQKEYLRSRR